MRPKINFRCSWIYDEKMKELYQVIQKERKTDYKYPEFKETLQYTHQIFKKWSGIADNIMNAIEKTSGLKWKEKYIRCYVVGRTISFSDPLTMGMVEDKGWFVDILVHELIHQIFIQNLEERANYWRYLEKKYPKYDFSTRVHIPLEAIHKNIYLNLFSKKNLERDIQTADKIAKYTPQYKIAWNTVEKEGYLNIIKEFKKFK